VSLTDDKQGGILISEAMMNEVRDDLVAGFGEEADAIMADAKYTEWKKE